MADERLTGLYEELGEHTLTPDIAKELTKHDAEADKAKFDALAKATAIRDEADYGVFLDAPVPGIEYVLIPDEPHVMPQTIPDASLDFGGIFGTN